MVRLLGIVALAVFGVSAAVHACTFLPFIPVSMNFAWPLHLMTMAVFAAMVISLVRYQKRSLPKPTGSIFAKWRSAAAQSRAFQSQLLSAIPLYLIILCIGAFIYAAVNFALFIELMKDGGPAVQDGKYYLRNHGKISREITRAEYKRYCAYEVRGFSGHWMIFSLVPAVYFLAVYPRLQESQEPIDDKQTELSLTPEKLHVTAE